MIDRLIEMLQSRDAGLTRMLALTPALGFLAKTQEQWQKLEEAILKNSDYVEMTCQELNDLKKWHAAFEGRYTERQRISKDLVDGANKASEALMMQVRRYNRLPWKDLPDFYLFSNDERAIIVTPFYLPRLDIPDLTDQERRALPNVEMFGSESTDRKIIGMVKDLHNFYAKPPGPPGVSVAAAGSLS